MSTNEQELVYRDEYDLSGAWSAMVQEYRKTSGTLWAMPDRTQFLAAVRAAVTDSDETDVVWCEACSEPVWQDEAESLANGHHACLGCYEDSYRPCADCERVVHEDDTCYIEGIDSSVCNRCLNNYSFCDECDTYYDPGYADDHRHNDCDCESPAQQFVMRNGDGFVQQDERFSATLPSGVISEEAMTQITRLIRNHSYTAANEVNPTNSYEGEAWEAMCQVRNQWWDVADKVAAMDPTWQTREGNFTKRLSKLAHKTHGLKVPPALLTQVGNVARDNSSGADLKLEVTRNLNLSAEDFYHEDSCWWQSYSESRCSLKTNGGIGLRTFGKYDEIQGRAWIQPLRLNVLGELEPTFDAAGADAFVIYNGYGDLSGYAPARIVADMVGLTYRKIGFEMSPQYVNGNTGYLVATEDVIERYAAKSYGLRIYSDTHSTLYHREQQAAAQAELVSA